MVCGMTWVVLEKELEIPYCDLFTPTTCIPLLFLRTFTFFAGNCMAKIALKMAWEMLRDISPLTTKHQEYHEHAS